MKLKSKFPDLKIEWSKISPKKNVFALTQVGEIDLKLLNKNY